MEHTVTNDTDRIIERVRKMMNLANNAGATEGERDNALRMAHATMAKYNIEQAALEARGEAVDPRGIRRVNFFGRPWARTVAAAMAELFFCEYLFNEATVAKNTTHVFIGKQSNSATASELAKWFVDCIMREGKRSQRASGEGNKHYRSFAMGAALRLAMRVAELRRAKLAAPVAGTAIVLASVYDSERAANSAVKQQAFPKVRESTRDGIRRLDGNALHRGVRYADTLNLDVKPNAPRIGGSK